MHYLFIDEKDHLHALENFKIHPQPQSRHFIPGNPVQVVLRDELPEFSTDFVGKPPADFFVVDEKGMRYRCIAQNIAVGSHTTEWSHVLGPVIEQLQLTDRETLDAIKIAVAQLKR